ncbi:MAG: hypothetical protein HOQ18_18375 [Dermatophilaceae bacterium]|nr:hypothetical protein [Dermatophilaceae bacterium]NUO92768.1 hypothetical protein [Dermatophilaceae bacterium]NUR16693.1 hypothetical protein [Dermatophilaceae bacterium]
MVGRNGFVHDLDEATYHADRESLSVSGAKVLLKAPALFKWQQEHPVHRDVFDVGSAAHKLVLGVGAPIRVVDADSWRTKDAKAEKDAAHAAGEIPLLAADYRRVQDMADALSSHRLAMRLLSEGQPEVSAYAVDDATGVTRRGRFDWLGTSILTDYKTCASADPRDLAGRYGAIRKWGYDQQAAWYTDLASDLGHPASAFAFIFQSKEPPHLVTVAYIDDSDLWDARIANARALELFAECTETGHWPGYLPDDTAALVSLQQQTYESERIA